jgi:hypothetical protein
VSLQGSTHALTPDEDLDPLPFVVDVLTSTKLFGAAVAWPQRPFRGERLLMSATYIPAAASPFDVGDLVVITPAMFAGAAQVGASQGDTPISAYSGKNFGVRLSFPPTGQGSRIYIPFVSNLPITAGDSIIVTCTLLGGAVR